MITSNSIEAESSKVNTLFPVFIKLEQLHVLIVGGGKIGLEKVSAIFNNSPTTKVTLVAISVLPAIKAFQREHEDFKIIEKEFELKDLDNKDLVIAATGDRSVSELIQVEAKKRKILINVADTPDLCDFYLGSIVQKGDLKIAISTNGKSPTFAKRLKEVFNAELKEEDIQTSINNLNSFRNHLKGDFDTKIKQLNKITASLVVDAEPEKVVKEKTRDKILRIGAYALTAVSLMLLGHLVFTLLPLSTISDYISSAVNSIDSSILIYILGGAIAQLIDGALGMAYGVSVTTFLLSLGIPSITPAVASASMHAAEVFTTGTSSLVYMKLKSVNLKLFKTLLVPGAAGAICGALIISYFSKESVAFVRPFVSAYTLFLGILILRKALDLHITARKKLKRIKPVAFFGGMLDSVGGGGWGPIVTTSLIAGGRDLRYAIGSSHMAKFFVATISTFTFFAIIGIHHWQIILGLVIGSMSVAPLSIYLSTKISKKWGLVLVGFVVIIVSLRTFYKLLF